ncbi:Wzz/FepE/Etk N-terminal domain-containing protein [Phnomibacter ginsenosidimutans]|uniref:Polysaccharide chain length determinant N-terminal domain-containing protein n=1 Tax=Phnomibacter ginsenosidimutans TaxID=2676868 RepID=A0A6I6GK39_9BACT|nr:Wzz/FepE/Etk N-terminal domain-containing protein [Phnomibacter ginsenosidimutans]QGW28785.1 hypothetical protein GLV81_12340 [Phnomibacter ginsenosidimutans]
MASSAKNNISQAKIDLGNQESSKFDVLKLAAKAVSILPWYILSVIFCLLAAYVYLEFASPVYNAYSVVMIRDRRVSGDEQKVLSSLNLGSSDRSIENEQDVLKSLTLMTRVVDSLKLDLQFHIEGRIRKLMLYGKAAPFIVDYYQPGDHENGNVFFGEKKVRINKTKLCN